MAVTKEVLSQYLSEKKEIEELQKKEHELGEKIAKIEEKILKIEELHTKECDGAVVDIKLQGFLIDDDFFEEWDDKKTELELKSRMLVLTKALLQTSETQLILREKQVEQFILTINDSVTRRIMRLRFLDGLAWKHVAKKIGGNNTESGVKAIYYRFMEKA